MAAVLLAVTRLAPKLMKFQASKDLNVANIHVYVKVLKGGLFLSFALSSLQVIGTLPLLVNPASLAGGAAASALPLHGLQVQTISPQLLLNTQGQIIATVGNGPAAVTTSAAVLPKASAPPTLTKPNAQVDGKNLSELSFEVRKD